MTQARPVRVNPGTFAGTIGKRLPLSVEATKQIEC